MKHKTEELYDFLKKNQKYNKGFQERYWNSILTPYPTIKGKAYSLLHSIFYTQTSPKLDKAKTYFEDFYRDKSASKSFTAFCKFNEVEKSNQPYNELFQAMIMKGGWGHKTSALFIKNIIQIHHHSKNDKIKFWQDVPKLSKEDTIYIPVDAVIIEIFRHINKSLKTFSSINKFIHTETGYPNDLVWDDLWFWGYITQKGSKSPRELVFNEPKYWTSSFAAKDRKTIRELNVRSNQFIKILKNK